MKKNKKTKLRETKNVPTLAETAHFGTVFEILNTF